jgi:hypothetical protein
MRVTIQQPRHSVSVGNRHSPLSSTYRRELEAQGKGFLEQSNRLVALNVKGDGLNVGRRHLFAIKAFPRK